MISALRPCVAALPKSFVARSLHSSCIRRSSGLTNILADGTPPPVLVHNITSTGHIELLNGMILPGPCIFLGGKVFLWDVPPVLSDTWGAERFQIFDVVIPKPEIMLFGTGNRTSQLPPVLRTYLRQIGIQVDIMDTRNACSTYNLLAEEGRNVAAALLPLSPSEWQRVPSSQN
ncbi:DUF498-domain-containing protein [Hysterangium stoloniferum]|nr:DUF498-domain-containing protein [Hysterangium stoloniferum]